MLYGGFDGRCNQEPVDDDLVLLAHASSSGYRLLLLGGRCVGEVENDHACGPLDVEADTAGLRTHDEDGWSYVTVEVVNDALPSVRWHLSVDVEHVVAG